MKILDHFIQLHYKKLFEKEDMYIRLVFLNKFQKIVKIHIIDLNMLENIST
jgi:hypothetical protein